MLHFAGIGAQKCGSSWLHTKLTAHPGVSFPAGKEVHFWDKKRERGISYYRSLFARDDGRLHGEITPAYAILPPDTIAECRRFFPDLRLIYVIRNPAERAWSHAKMDALAAGHDPAQLPDEWFLRHFRSTESLSRGDYETCIRHWLAAYPEENFLLLFFEELVLSPASFLRKCCDHLGLANIYQSELSTPDGRVFGGPPDLIRPNLHPRLRELYQDKISGLAEFLHRDLSAWQR